MGWASLVFILKEEGFYIEACFDPDVLDKTNSSGVLVDASLSVIENNVDGTYDVMQNASTTTVTSSIQGSTKGTLVVSHRLTGCPEQESRLNLWFSIALSFMYLSFTAVGYLIKKIGTRYTRLIFIIGYLVGTMCLAFATPAIPWLLLPGLCLMGISGLVVLATNLQVADLHPHIRSTIVAIFTGLFDFSSIMKQLVKIGYENGIIRRYSYIAIGIAFVAMVTLSTLFLLPHTSITEEQVDEIKRRRSSVKIQEIEKMRKKMKIQLTGTETTEHKKALLSNHTVENGVITNSPTEPIAPAFTSTQAPRLTLCQVLMSFTCILHLYWLFVHALRFVTFIGLMNVWLGDIYNDEMKVGELLGVFSYMTMGAIGTAILCGTIYDWQRTRHLDAGPIRKVYIPVVLPMVLVIIYSILTTIMCFIQNPVTPYIAFALFTFFRSSLFTVAVAFFGEA